MFICICGFEGNNIHGKFCNKYKNEVNRIKQNIRKDNLVLEKYKELYSVTKLCKYIKKKEKTELYESKLRDILVEYLKEIGIYEGLNGPNYLKQKQKEYKSIMTDRYGVINAGQMTGNGWEKSNKIPYRKLQLDNDLSEYKKSVQRRTKYTVRKLYNDNNIPSYCEYTGIRFADEQGETNPNDPLKRTVDHIIPVVEGYLNGLSVEEMCNRKNLSFCIRYCNTLKGAMDLETFKTKIARPLREKLIDEGYEYKKN